MREVPTTTTATASTADSVPDIQTLTLRVQQLDQRADWWNAMMVLALIFAAVAAVAVVITTRMALVRSKQLAEAQAELIDAKDKQVTLDLRAKDVKISELNETAERERLARVEIEDALAPRRLSRGQIKAIGAALRPFAGEFALMVYPMGDREAQVFANEILTALKEAQWTVTIPGGMLTGMEVGRIAPDDVPPNMLNPYGIKLSPTGDDKSILAAKAFASEFDALGFSCRIDEPDTKSNHRVQVYVVTRPLGPQGAARLRAEEHHTRK